MCRRRRITAIAGVLALAAALAAEDAAAQQAAAEGARVDATAPIEAAATPADAAAERARLTARLDSLLPLLDEARAARDRRHLITEEMAREAAAAIARVDTLRVGLVTVITPVDQAETARALFGEVWQERYADIERNPALEEQTFTFQWSDELVPIHVGSGSRAVHAPTRTDRAEVKEAIRREIGAAVTQDLHRVGAGVAAWATGNPFVDHDLEEAYRVVATRQSRSARSCLQGDMDACGSALGIDAEPTVEQLRAWYTPEERRALVAERVSADRINGSRHLGCLEHRDYTACDELLGDFQQDWTPIPRHVRETVLAYALERGGAGAWQRLVDHPEMEVAPALEHASGMTLPELLAGWHASLLESRPEAFADIVPSSGRSLVWILLFVAMAMRSTRWRFG